MEHRKSIADIDGGEPKLDLSGLLGDGRVFDASRAAAEPADLIDANCNRVGSEGPLPT